MSEWGLIAAKAIAFAVIAMALLEFGSVLRAAYRKARNARYPYIPDVAVGDNFPVRGGR